MPYNLNPLAMAEKEVGAYLTISFVADLVGALFLGKPSLFNWVKNYQSIKAWI